MNSISAFVFDGRFYNLLAYAKENKVPLSPQRNLELIIELLKQARETNAGGISAHC